MTHLVLQKDFWKGDRNNFAHVRQDKKTLANAAGGKFWIGCEEKDFLVIKWLNPLINKMKKMWSLHLWRVFEKDQMNIHGSGD